MKKVLLTLLLVFTVFVANAQSVVTVSGIDVDTVKVFDATDSAFVVNHGTLAGVAPGDVVSVFTEAHYATINADSGITITVTSTLQGADAAFYTLINPITTLTGRIEKRQLYRDSVVLMPFKIYDGMVECPIQFSGIARNYVTHHILTTIDTCVFLDPNVGNNKPVRVIFGMSGEDEQNYIPPRDTVMESSIIPRKLVTKGTSIQTVKQYDGTPDAQVLSKGSFTNVLEDDEVNFTLSAAYEDKDAGQGKNIHSHFEISGASAVNYSAPDDGLYMNGEIMHIQLTASGGEAVKSKTYDGTTSCEVTTPSQPVGVINNERVYLNTMAAYDTPSVGTNHVITFSYTIYGNDAFNYIAPEDSVYCTDGVIVDEAGVDDVVALNAVWPNPFVDEVNVVCPMDGEHHIYIYGVSGQVFRSESFSGVTCRMDLSSLASGIYLFSVDGRATKLIKK
ncbi:MAG: YDG domain-containing protein [Paludibacteraceae bacterium]|nr:YDG domain-containing protein [Paludibacteraceae bacterium]